MGLLADMSEEATNCGAGCKWPGGLILLLIFIYMGIGFHRIQMLYLNYFPDCWEPAEPPSNPNDVEDPLYRLISKIRVRLLGKDGGAYVIMERERGEFVRPEEFLAEPERTERILAKPLRLLPANAADLIDSMTLLWLNRASGSYGWLGVFYECAPPCMGVTIGSCNLGGGFLSSKCVALRTCGRWIMLVSQIAIAMVSGLGTGIEAGTTIATAQVLTVLCIQYATSVYVLLAGASCDRWDNAIVVTQYLLEGTSTLMLFMQDYLPAGSGAIKEISFLCALLSMFLPAIEKGYDSIVVQFSKILRKDDFSFSEAAIALLAFVLTLPALIAGILGLELDDGGLTTVLEETGNIFDGDSGLVGNLSGLADAASNVYWATRQRRRRELHDHPVQAIKVIQRRFRLRYEQRKAATIRIQRLVRGMLFRTGHASSVASSLFWVMLSEQRQRREELEAAAAALLQAQYRRHLSRTGRARLTANSAFISQYREVHRRWTSLPQHLLQTKPRVLNMGEAPQEIAAVSLVSPLIKNNVPRFVRTAPSAAPSDSPSTAPDAAPDAAPYAAPDASSTLAAPAADWSIVSSDVANQQPSYQWAARGGLVSVQRVQRPGVQWLERSMSQALAEDGGVDWEMSTDSPPVRSRVASPTDYSERLKRARDAIANSARQVTLWERVAARPPSLRGAAPAPSLAPLQATSVPSPAASQATDKLHRSVERELMREQWQPREMAQRPGLQGSTLPAEMDLAPELHGVTTHPRERPAQAAEGTHDATLLVSELVARADDMPDSQALAPAPAGGVTCEPTSQASQPRTIVVREHSADGNVVHHVASCTGRPREGSAACEMRHEITSGRPLPRLVLLRERSPDGRVVHHRAPFTRGPAQIHPVPDGRRRQQTEIAENAGAGSCAPSTACALQALAAPSIAKYSAPRTILVRERSAGGNSPDVHHRAAFTSKSQSQRD